MKKVFLGIFIAIALACTIWSIYYITSPLNSTELVADTMEYLVNDMSATIIRDEKVYYSQIEGTLYHHANEGDRVAKDSLISTVFSGVISDENLKELRTIDKKINHRRKKLSESSIYHIDGTDTESKIATIINDITPASENNDILKISDYKEDLNNLRNGIEISDEEILQSLILEKEAVENRISTGKNEITTDNAGIFTTYVDGFEEALNPANIENYTVGYMESLGNAEPVKLEDRNVSANGAVCKIVNNHIWYAALAIPASEADKHEIGEEVTLRFRSIAGEKVKGSIFRINENEENGKKLVIVKCPVYFEGAFAYRKADMDMIFESYSGYKVPVHAIRSDDDGSKYVRAMSGTREFDCYCEILYSDTESGFVIIQSTDDASHKLNNMERIVTGER